MKRRRVTWLVGVLTIVAVMTAGWLVWGRGRDDGVGAGIASGNGRIEATEINISAKFAGRITAIEVAEGDFVIAGQILARMDTGNLQAQRAEAQAHVRQADNAHAAALALVAQRQSAHAAAEAVVAQRMAELTVAEREHARIAPMVETAAASPHEADNAKAALESAKATVAAAKAEVAAAQAGIIAAQAQVIEAASVIEAAKATVVRIESDINEGDLKAPRSGRVQYRVAETGEVLAPGGTVLNLVDVSDVYLTFFLPTAQAGRVALGDQARIVLDALPEYVLPARISYVASVAQFTPKTVETENERAKLMFRVRARIDPELLLEHLEQVKTGLPGMAYVRINRDAQWPTDLEARVPR